MKDGLIKRSDAIKVIAKVLSLNRFSSFKNIKNFDRFAEQMLRCIPSADRPQEWIPCSERLPSEDEQDPELGVIVTLGNGYSGLQYDWYHDGHWYDWDGFVVAWMPLPKPWKGADDDRRR